jgi:hypothetical protein
MKITMQMLDIFARFRGDIDGFARGGKAAEKDAIPDENWRCIDELLQEIFVLQKGLVTPEYRERIVERLRVQTEGPLVADRLLLLAQQLAPADGSPSANHR